MATTFAQNSLLMRMIVIVMIASICMGMFSQGILYHFKYHLNSPDSAVFGLVLLTAFMIFAVPFWAGLAGRTSKRTSLSVGLLIALIGYLIFFFNFANSLAVSLVAISVIGFGTAALGVMFWAMLPDTVEYGEAMTGVRAEAKTFGFATFAQKSAVGVSAVLFGAFLDMVGFVPNTDQSDQALLGLRIILSLAPAAGVIIIFLILRGYHLDSKRHAELVAQIADSK